MTPPPYVCRSIKVKLGAHNIKKKERTQQVIPVRRAIPHPGYNDKTQVNDIMLLQVGHVAASTLGHFPPRALHPPDLIPDLPPVPPLPWFEH